MDILVLLEILEHKIIIIIIIPGDEIMQHLLWSWWSFFLVAPWCILGTFSNLGIVDVELDGD